MSTNDNMDEQTPALAKPLRVWTVFVSVVLGVVGGVVAQAFVAAAVLIAHTAGGGDVQEFAKEIPNLLLTPTMFILFAISSQLVFGLAAVLPAWLSATPFRERLGLVRAGPSASIYPLAMLGTIVPTAIGFGLAYGLALFVPPDKSVQILFGNMTLADALPFVLVIALAPGICEELLFRGYMQRRLLQRWGPGWAIGVTSVIFAVVHIAPHTVVLALPIGVWFGYVAWRSGSIYPAMLCHAFVNGSVNLWRVIVKFGEVSQTVQYVVPSVSLVVGLACFLLTIRQLRAPAKEGVSPM